MFDSILPFFVAKSIVCYTLAYTKPSSSFRPVAVLLVIICCLASVRSTVANSLPGQVGAEYIIGFILHANHWLCLARISPPTPSKSLKPGSNVSWAFYQTFDARWGIPTKSLPCFDKQNPSKTPSRSRFLINTLWDLLCMISILYVCSAYTLNVDERDLTEVPAGFLNRILLVTPREMIIRIYFTILSTLVPYCALRASHNAAAFVAVLCGGGPAGWLPLYGSIKEAYSMRRFYSIFWHQLMRRAFTSHAVFFVTRILRLPRNSKISRYVTVIVTFMISALLHIAANPGIPLTCQAWPQIRFFMTVGLAIMLEDPVIKLYRLALGKGSRKTAHVLGMDAKNSNDHASKETAKVDNRIIDTADPTTSATTTATRAARSETPNTKLRRAGPKTPIQTSKEPAPQTEADAPISLHWRIFGYCWVIAFELWASSKMIYSTQQCMLAL